MEEITTGTLLGGRLSYRQFATGHRTGFEPVLLAAAVPAKPGECVLEAGTGAGAALLCLAARVPGITGTGIEIDPALAALANENFQINNLPNLSAIAADITTWRTAQKFDHACATPPWFDAASTPSPDQARRRPQAAGEPYADPPRASLPGLLVRPARRRHRRPHPHPALAPRRRARGQHHLARHRRVKGAGTDRSRPHPA